MSKEVKKDTKKVEKMDKIIFVDDGEIRAVGTHAELLAGSSEYRTMVELQRLEEEKGGEENEG